jgi:hypothetical protein
MVSLLPLIVVTGCKLNSPSASFSVDLRDLRAADLTRNHRDFIKVPELVTEDWTQP